MTVGEIEKNAWIEALRASPFSFVMPFIALVFGMFPVILSGYHSHLICLNITTNESCKGSFKRTGNPFAKINCFQNMKSVFCIKGRLLWRPDNILTTTAASLFDDNGGTLIDMKQVSIGRVASVRSASSSKKSEPSSDRERDAEARNRLIGLGGEVEDVDDMARVDTDQRMLSQENED